MLIIRSILRQRLNLFQFREISAINKRKVVRLKLRQLINNDFDLLLHLHFVLSVIFRGRCALREQITIIASKQYRVVPVVAVQVRVSRLQDFEDHATNAPHVLRLIVLFLH